MSLQNLFDTLTADLANGVHHLGSDVLKVMLSNTQPTNGNSVKTDIAEIPAGNGYSTGGQVLSVLSSDQVGGLYRLIPAAAVIFTAAGGSIGPFRFLVLYNNSTPSNRLIAWWDYGNSTVVTNGNSFNASFDTVNGVIEIPARLPVGPTGTFTIGSFP